MTNLTKSKFKMAMPYEGIMLRSNDYSGDCQQNRMKNCKMKGKGQEIFVGR